MSQQVIKMSQQVIKMSQQVIKMSQQVIKMSQQVINILRLPVASRLFRIFLPSFATVPSPLYQGNIWTCTRPGLS